MSKEKDSRLIANNKKAYHDYFIEEKYLNEIFKLIDNDKNDFYYVMMVKAWLISICYVKYPKETLNYLKTYKNR